tara:strand:+ start:511 stop:903 length:393 start_codon:yes stop_codon:yes gene_type:complete
MPSIPDERESWRMEFTLECRDEEEANEIFEAFTASLEDINFTHWSAKMARDLNMEAALKKFRENKDEILASLPDEVVQQYYPDRVAISDEIKEKYSHLTQETQRSMQRKHNSLKRHLEVVPELEEDENAS